MLAEFIQFYVTNKQTFKNTIRPELYTIEIKCFGVQVKWQREAVTDVVASVAAATSGIWLTDACHCGHFALTDCYVVISVNNVWTRFGWNCADNSGGL